MIGNVSLLVTCWRYISNMHYKWISDLVTFSL